MSEPMGVNEFILVGGPLDGKRITFRNPPPVVRLSGEHPLLISTDEGGSLPRWKGSELWPEYRLTTGKVALQPFDAVQDPPMMPAYRFNGWW